MSKNTLFVYGSLMTGMVSTTSNKVAGMIKEIKPATCEGVLYRLVVGYPALIDGAGVVKGELLTLNNFKEIIKILDEFEGYSVTSPEKSFHLRI